MREVNLHLFQKVQICQYFLSLCCLTEGNFLQNKVSICDDYILSKVESGQYLDGSSFRNAKCYNLRFVHSVKDNGWEFEISEPSSNFSWARYIHLHLSESCALYWGNISIINNKHQAFFLSGESKREKEKASWLIQELFSLSLQIYLDKMYCMASVNLKRP